MALPKIAYLLARDINNEAAADFVASLAATELTLEIPRQEDYSRSAGFCGSIPMPSSIL
jgi:hypothetical protein